MVIFNGKIDDDQIQKFGWKTDPFDGLKIMKNDLIISSTQTTI